MTDYNKPLEYQKGDPKYSSKDDLLENTEKISIDADDLGEGSTDDIVVIDRPDLELDEGLDVSDTDLDDEDGLIGEEYEENNYFSLGDNHDDLEETEEE
ncbi:MAG: hypothetical protein QM610_11070 [Chitinophagaceae bacterium]